MKTSSNTTAASLSSTRWSNWDAPYEKTGVKLGDEQFALADDWAASGKIALIGMGVEPGLAGMDANPNANRPRLQLFQGFLNSRHCLAG